LRGVVRAKLKGQIASRLGGGIVDANLKHRKTAFQLDRSLLGTFLGAELGLQATIDFESETVFGEFNRPDGHSETRRWHVPHQAKVSLAGPTSPF
jgi:hypothetical protein